MGVQFSPKQHVSANVSISFELSVPGVVSFGHCLNCAAMMHLYPVTMDQNTSLMGETTCWFSLPCSLMSSINQTNNVTHCQISLSRGLHHPPWRPLPLPLPLPKAAPAWPCVFPVPSLTVGLVIALRSVSADTAAMFLPLPWPWPS